MRRNPPGASRELRVARGRFLRFALFAALRDNAGLADLALLDFVPVFCARLVGRVALEEASVSRVR
jgi:hypothetical protein